MKVVKIICIVIEVSALVAVALLSFSDLEVETYIKGLYTVLFSLLAVTFQKEQQSIDWDEEQEDNAEIEIEDWDEEKFQDQLEQYIEGWG